MEEAFSSHPAESVTVVKSFCIVKSSLVLSYRVVLMVDERTGC